MAATFFDTAAQADLNLLHESIRTHDELDNVVEQVEWEILDFYSQRENVGISNYDDFFEFEAGNDPNNEIKVRLVGYDQDTPADSQSNLKTALKRTIADVASWVLRNYETTQGASQITQGKRSITRSPDSVSWRSFPDGWRSRLKNFDARLSHYGI